MRGLICPPRSARGKQSNYGTTYSKNANYACVRARASLIFPFISDPFTHGLRSVTDVTRANCKNHRERGARIAKNHNPRFFPEFSDVFYTLSRLSPSPRNSWVNTFESEFAGDNTSRWAVGEKYSVATRNQYIVVPAEDGGAGEGTGERGDRINRVNRA